MNCCDDFGKCTQGENCPVRIKPYQKKESHEDSIFTSNINEHGTCRNVRLYEDDEPE